jgi:3'-5' exoribonuclease 1
MVLLLCLALAPFSDHLPSLFLALSITSLVFLWCSSSNNSGTRTNHSTPHSDKAPSDAVHDMFSVLKNPTTTSTTVATNYITPSAVPRPDAAPIPPRNDELPQSSQCQTAWLCQPYDAFLVLDVEATCLQGTGFHWPNEIIEWPVCLLKWTGRWDNGMVGPLQKVAEFRSFVKPTWRPELSSFCTSLTGITQEQVDNAPHFPEVVTQFSAFLAHHGLIHPVTGERLLRFCWCTDGPFDVRDFVVKQCFISNVRA